MRIGIAADHGEFVLKGVILDALTSGGAEVVDFGAQAWTPEDDYPDYVFPLAKAVASSEVDRGIAICGSGVGASIAANKIPGARAGLVHDVYSAHQGVEHDDMNIICLGSRVIGDELAKELVLRFLAAKFSGDERHVRRLQKIAGLDQQQPA